MRPKDSAVDRVRRELWFDIIHHATEMRDQRDKGDWRWAEYHKLKARALKRAWLWVVEQSNA